jgi:hypothetical protein
MSIADESVSFSLEVNVTKAYEDIRRLQTVFYRTLGLVRRLSGDENLNRTIDIMQRAIATANRLRLAMAALQAARMAAGDPIAWATAGISFAEVGADFTTELTGR